MLERSQNNGIDRKEFEEIFDSYYERIKNYIFYRCGNVELAEDLTQEVFIKIWQIRNKIIKSTVNSLLYSIASNLFINDYNRKKVKLNFINTTLHENSNIESPEYLIELKEFDNLLQNAINDMPEKSQVVFLMNRIDNLTYNEIANSLKLSVKAVEKRMSKALTYMEEKVGKRL